MANIQGGRWKTCRRVLGPIENFLPSFPPLKRCGFNTKFSADSRAYCPLFLSLTYGLVTIFLLASFAPAIF
ncbi:hypothetical protein CPB83DRAFT_244862 [Crepidotus variabilis]|uniref:Uncharacterized protein n=1 Tax=Crepidotus variabilis TaxID=179855 RepID=A0A9P6JRX6_9AGAR|nr:hypothetical protein CPB83DRAFT_244862 [Crepidotus variabilis]